MGFPRIAAMGLAGLGRRLATVFAAISNVLPRDTAQGGPLLQLRGHTARNKARYGLLLIGSVIFLAIGGIFSTAHAQDPARSEIVIAMLGDSLTQGYGLPEGDGFVPQLQAWLNAPENQTTADAATPVRLINAGVSGDTTAGGLSRAAWTFTPDVDAVVIALGGNDVLRGLPVAAARANLEGIILAAGTRPILLIGITAPLNYGPEYKAGFEAIYTDLAAQHGLDVIDSFLTPLTAETDLETARATYLQADGLHPNQAGVARIVAAFGPTVRALAGQVGAQ